MECIVEKEKNELVIVNDGESISVYVDGIDYAWSRPAFVIGNAGGPPRMSGGARN